MTSSSMSRGGRPTMTSMGWRPTMTSMGWRNDIAGESGEVVSLLDAAGQTHRVLKSEIAAREVSALSLMPAIFGEVLSGADFRDLVGWLMAP